MEGTRRLFCDQCDRPLYENPIPATCLVVLDQAQRTLLVKRSVEPKKGYWCLPGGFVELDESPDNAALRELKEETGLSGQIESLLGVMATPNSEYGTVLMVGYRVKTYTGALLAGDDADDAAYFSRDALPEIAFESHKAFIKIAYGKKERISVQDTCTVAD